MSGEYRSPLLQQPGAVAGEGPDAGVALHYGSPVHEQRALESGGGVVDLSHHSIVRVSGPDRLSWLSTISTQQILQLTPGESAELLVLDPNGRIEHAAGVLDDGEATWLLTDAGRGEALVAYLESMRFMLRVEVGQAPGHALLGVAGDAARQALREAAGEDVLIWRDPWPQVVEGGARYGPALEDHPGSELDWALVVVPRSRLESVVSASGLRLAGTWAAEAVRVAAWRPRLGREVDDRAIPHELDWLRTAVHLEKGCYRGQETVARVVNLGRPPRRLVLLHLDGSDHTIPDPGAPVSLGGRDVGVVTSVVRHGELGPVALALVKRSVPAEVQVSVAGIAAAQEVIVPTDGTSSARPAQRPGAELRRRPGR